LLILLITENQNLLARQDGGDTGAQRRSRFGTFRSGTIRATVFVGAAQAK
jgi:hypothetical protein